MQAAVIEPSLIGSEAVEAFPAGSPLFREGEIPRGVYVIRTGEVDVVFAARNGNTRPFALAGPGQILGLSAVVTRRPHECSAITRTRCEIGFISQEALFRALEEVPAVRFQVLRILSSEVNAAYDAMRSRVYLNHAG